MGVSPLTALDEALLERQAELEALERTLSVVEQGTGQLAVLEGSAGLGKTRLVEAGRWRARDRGFALLHARAAELERDFPFGVVLQLFEPRLVRATESDRGALLSGAAASAAPLFDIGDGVGAPAGQLAEGDAPYTTLHGLYWLCANLATEAPLLVSVDDVHWADAPSRRFLSYLLRRLEGIPVMVLLTLRPAEAPADHDLLEEIAASPVATVIRPGPLSPDGVATLVRERLSAEAAEPFTRACHEMTAGNPLLLRELLLELAAARVQPTEDGAHQLRKIGPRSVSRIVLRRLTRLHPTAKKLARAVAVLEARAELRHAAALSGLDADEAGESAGALADAELVMPGPRLDFIHPIVRAAIYRDIPSAERARMHAHAARLLRDDDAPADQVAAHLLATQPASDPWVVEVLRAAASRAMAQGTPAAAISYLRRALEEPPQAGELPELTAELGIAETRARRPEAVARLSEALEMSTDPDRRAAIALELGRALAMEDRLAEAIDVLGAGAAELAAGDADLRLRLEAELLATARLGVHTRPVVAERLESFRGQVAGRAPAERVLLANLAYEAVIQGEPADHAAELAARALGGGTLLAEEGSESPTYYYAVWALALCDRLSDAAHALDAAIDDARARGSELGYGLASSFRSNVHYRQGLVLDAEADARNGLAVATQEGPDARLPLATAFLIDALMERGELEEAARTIERAGMGGAFPESIAFNAMLVSRGQLRVLQGRVDEGLADLLENGRRGAAWGARTAAFFPWRSAAALALARLDRAAEAVPLVEEEVELARAFGAPRPLGIALRAAGLVADGDEGIARLEEAISVLEPSPARLEHARALVDLGAALRRANRRSAAREQLRAGFAIAKDCGARALAARAQQELAATGARARTAIERDSLTPSEQRVARMAAEGLGNREIAQALFITPKTVEWHLGQAYRKLGVRSRRALPEALEAGAPQP